MQTGNQMPNDTCSEPIFSYSYLLQWEWPEHIERLLRRVLFAQLRECELADENDQSLCDSVAARLYWLIAVYPESNPAVLHALASTQLPEPYLARIAENPNAHVKTLELLSTHTSDRVRTAVAENLKTPVATLMQLTRDESLDLRYCMAENPNIPLEVLDVLGEDENCYVASRAQQTLCKLRPNQPAIFTPRRDRFSRVNTQKVARG